MMWYNEMTKRFRHPFLHLLTTIYSHPREKNDCSHSSSSSLRLWCPWALHLFRNYGSAPHQAPSDVRKRFERCWGLLRQSHDSQGANCSPSCAQVQRWWFVDAVWLYFFLKMLIAIDQDISITPYSGRILRLPTNLEDRSQKDLLKMPLCTLLEALTISSSNSTPPLLESKDLDGVGSYVP